MNSDPRTTRTKPTNTATPAERQAKKVARAEQRDKRQGLMEDANKQVKAIAGSIAEQLGDHNEDYYYRKIMQQSKTIDKPREVNRWNTFLSMETTEMNKGECLQL